jgi:hypothetical protein
METPLLKLKSRLKEILSENDYSVVSNLIDSSLDVERKFVVDFAMSITNRMDYIDVVDRYDNITRKNSLNESTIN